MIDSEKERRLVVAINIQLKILVSLWFHEKLS